MSETFEALCSLYQQRCHVEGEGLETFFEAVREDHTPADLRALLDRVEEDIVQNITMMLAANPALAAQAEARARVQRERITALRATLDP